LPPACPQRSADAAGLARRYRSAQAVNLAKGALQTMTGTKLACVMVVVVALGGAGVGGDLVGPGVGRQARANRQLQDKGEDLGEARPSSNEAALHVVAQGKPGADRPAREGIKVTLASARQEYRPGESVDLVLTIKNNGKTDFPYLKAKLLELRGFAITGPDGKEVKPVNNPAEIDHAALPFTVQPGEAVTIRDALEGINLSKNPKTDNYRREMYYPMDFPGTYRLRIKVGKWTSNELAIKVLPADGFGDEVKGLRARVSFAKEKFPAGEPIAVKYVVTNVSQQEQTLWHSGFWPNHLIIVHDAAGMDAPLTAFGRQCRQAFSPGGERGKNAPVRVPAGGEDAAYEKYDLTKLYDLSMPGRYTVQYVYEEKQGGWVGKLPSNEAAFEVLRPGKKRAGLAADESKLQGLWLATELDGAGQPAARGAREFRMLVKGDKIVLESKGEKREYRFKLRSVPPNQGIDLLPVRGDGREVTKVLPGIYHMAGDRLRLCFYKDATKGRPPEFSAKIDIGLWVLACTHVVESKPVRAQGLEFVALAPVGVSPTPTVCDFDVSLRVTNVCDKPLGLSTFDVIRPRLYFVSGKRVVELEMASRRKDAPRLTLPAKLAPGASWMWRPEAQLSWTGRDRSTLELSGPDGRGVAGAWTFGTLREERRYRLAIEYANSTPKQGETALWVGKATTDEVEFEIAARRKLASAGEPSSTPISAEGNSPSIGYRPGWN
jgi:uncharacterized protein (TIGR03067 family)